MTKQRAAEWVCYVLAVPFLLPVWAYRLVTRNPVMPESAPSPKSTDLDASFWKLTFALLGVLGAVVVAFSANEKAEDERKLENAYCQRFGC